ncbi:MAG: ABC transporter ATP-binding protein, partial [Rhodospirillaceae bacterium]|nr:ABC transporter ATP-binding protein [Rhodospirillaceae bacterium]
MPEPQTAEPLLQVRDLKMYFPVTDGMLVQRTIAHVKAVDGISFDIMPGETLGLVGESGCGKSTTGRCILQLEKPTAGQILYHGADLNRMGRAELAAMRRKIQVIFQDPYSSLNPRMTIGAIISEPMQVHNILPSEDARKQRVRELLHRCGLNPKFYDRYPHEMS